MAAKVEVSSWVTEAGQRSSRDRHASMTARESMPKVTPSCMAPGLGEEGDVLVEPWSQGGAIARHRGRLVPAPPGGGAPAEVGEEEKDEVTFVNLQVAAQRRGDTAPKLDGVPYARR